ncbi:MAG: arginine--tRNA ligase [Clostridia bacterium]|nr:arginine--tRNA ligase [Clostridia bacterium]
MDYKKYIAEKLNIEGVSSEEIASFITPTPSQDMGDYALPCFRFAKVLRKPPVVIAEDLKANFVLDDTITEVKAVNGYLNFTVNRAGFSLKTIQTILEEGETYGACNIGNGKTVCIDYSSINIAKPFHIGHLSTTVLGSSLYKIFNFLGYNAVGINHLGDYGTQFGKLIYAYKAWGDKETLQKDGLKELTRLYVKFHDEAESHPEMEDEARAYFKKIEENDPEALELFNWFKNLTLAETEKIYDLLQVKFDSYAGESFYNDKMQPVIDELKQKNLLTESDGAMVVDLSAYDMPPCIILRSDGASLYATRDLAAAYYRKNTYDFDKCLYVVAYQQNLHFKQIFKVLELLGKPWHEDMVHVAYGMVSLEEGSMSTRRGKVVWLEDVIAKCIEKCSAVINEKNPNLENKEETAKAVGVGAVIFGALSNNKIKDIVFSYDRVLNFDGETGPYVQYTGARCYGVLAKSDIDYTSFVLPEKLESCEYDLIAHLSTFPQTVKASAEKLEPCFITRYAIDLAKLYNKFYFECKILTAENEELVKFRLALTKAVRVTIENALSLLGIDAPTRM